MSTVASRPASLVAPAAGSLTDEALVTLHLSGDTDAFGELYRRYHRRLTTRIRAWGNPVHNAEDIAHDALLRALMRLDTFDPRRPLWPWLVGVARKAAIDAARKRGDVVHEDDNAADNSPPFEGLIEEQVLLSQALERVPPRQRHALTLRYLWGWKPADAAATLGITTNAFDQLMHRARARLRDEYVRIAPDSKNRLHAIALLALGALRDRARRSQTTATMASNVGPLTADFITVAMATVLVAVTPSGPTFEPDARPPASAEALVMAAIPRADAPQRRSADQTAPIRPSTRETEDTTPPPTKETGDTTQPSSTAAPPPATVQDGLGAGAADTGSSTRERGEDAVDSDVHVPTPQGDVYAEGDSRSNCDTALRRTICDSVPDDEDVAITVPVPSLKWPLSPPSPRD